MSNTQLDRAEINRRNAQYSTGPRTPEGKRRSSLNALRHGLTSHVVVMTTEDHEAYEAHLRAFASEYQPKGATETQLVQSLADAAWRLNRVSALETNLLTLGVLHEDLWHHETTYEMREALGVANVLDSHTKALSTLSLHGQRLSRQFEKTLALLQKLQSERLAKKPAPTQVNRIKDQTHDVPRRHQPNGFVFSKSSKTPSTPSTPTSDPSHPVDVN